MHLCIDFETRCTLELKDVGSWRYAEHSTCDILCLAIGSTAEDVEVWRPGVNDHVLARLYQHIEAGGLVSAWNVAFERAIWEQKMVPQYGAPQIANEQWRDTMAAAAYRSLPLKLDTFGKAVNKGHLKSDTGKSLLQKLAKPQRVTQKWLNETANMCPAEAKLFLQSQGMMTAPGVMWLDLGKGQGLIPYYWNNGPSLMQELCDYCAQDVRAEIDAYHLVKQPDGEWLPPNELKLWLLDQKMNARGVGIDTSAAKAAIEMFEVIERDAIKEINQITDGEVETPGQRDKILAWCKSCGLVLPDLTADTIDAYLKKDIPADVRRVLELRKQVGRASVKKLYMALKATMKDGRMRGLLQYHGAHSGRWSGRLLQPQNLPRPLPWLEETDPDTLIDLIKENNVGWLSALGEGDPIAVLVSAVRHMLKAGYGCQFVCCDFTAIESVVLFCLAGQENAIQDIRDGKRLYSVFASQMYGYPVSKKTHPKEDAAGKAGILGLGYQMGARALVAYAEAMGIDMDMETAQLAVDTYRKEYAPRVKALWTRFNHAVIKAVQEGVVTEVEGVRFWTETVNTIPYMIARLPSGRLMHYPYPSLSLQETPWSRQAREEWKNAFTLYEGTQNTSDPFPWPGAEPEVEEQLGVSFMMSKTGQWQKVRLYGGMITENVVQAIARDLLAFALINLDEEGYHLLLSTHDEALAELRGLGDEDHFKAVMIQRPEWAKDWPIGGDGWTGKRYRK